MIGREVLRSALTWLAASALLCACEGGPKDPSREDGLTTLTPLPRDAAFLFVSNRGVEGDRREIFAMNAAGGNVTRITDSPYHHHLIGISRDRRHIVATRSTVDLDGDGRLDDADSGKKSVWVLDLQEKKEMRLTSEMDLAEGKSISPDGEWVVFWMQRDGDVQSDIYKIRIDGTGLVNLTDTPWPSWNEYDPAWSSDGSRIVFNRFDPATSRVALYTMGADGGDERMVYDPREGVATPLFPKGAYDPAWSPDDQWIAFVKSVRFTGEGENLKAGIWNVFRIPADGRGSPLNLSEAGGHADGAEYLPSFSPDGGSIVFSSRFHDPSHPGSAHLDIFVMDAASGAITTRLTQTGLSAHDMFAVWVPRDPSSAVPQSHHSAMK